MRQFNLIRVNSPQLAAKGLFLIGALIPRSLLRGSSFLNFGKMKTGMWEGFWRFPACSAKEKPLKN